MDFDLDGLPLIQIDQHPPGFETIDGDPENGQTREVFVAEAVAVVAASHKLRWIAPSRDEDPAGPLDVVSVPQIVLGADDDSPAIDAIAVQDRKSTRLNSSH